MKREITLVLALVLILAFGRVASAAPLLSFGLDTNGDPSAFENDFTIGVGGVQTVDLYALVTDDGSGSDTLVDPILFTGFGIDLRYDAALLDVTSGSVDPQWNFGSSIDTTTDGSVVMTGSYFNFTPPPLGVDVPALLGSITFQCEGLGLSPLTIFDPDGLLGNIGLASPNVGIVLDAQLAGGMEIGSINQVPIPGPVLLLASGLVGLVGLRRRSRQ